MKRKASIFLALLFSVTASIGQGIVIDGTQHIYVNPDNTGTEDGASLETGYKLFKSGYAVVNTSMPCIIHLKETVFGANHWNNGSWGLGTAKVCPNGLTIDGNNAVFDASVSSISSSAFFDSAAETAGVESKLTFKNLTFQNFSYTRLFSYKHKKLEIENCRFIDNTTSASYPVIYAGEGTANKEITIRNSIFWNNTPTNIYTIATGNVAQLRVDGCVFYNIGSIGSSGVNGCPNTIFSNCLFYYSTGMTIDQVRLLGNSNHNPVILVNNTFYSNGTGNSIYGLEAVGDLVLVNNVIVNLNSYAVSMNKNASQGRLDIVAKNNVIAVQNSRIYNSNVQASEFDASNTIYTTSNAANVQDYAINTLKLAVTPATSSNVFICGAGKPYLPFTTGSPLINSGLNSYIDPVISYANVTAPATDILGTNRSDNCATGAAVDLGAWEYVLPKETTPATLIDFVAETLTNFVAETDYIIDSNEYIANENGKITIDAGWINTELSIVKKGNCINNQNSNPQTLEIPARPASPTTVSSSTGSINGTTTAMEYSTNGIDWFTCSAGSTTVGQGTYYVRLKAIANTAFASEYAEVTVSTATSVIESELQVIPSLYPNPASDYVIIKNAAGKAVSIYTSLGSKVFETAQLNGENISIAGWTPGIYLVKVNGIVLRLIKN